MVEKRVSLLVKALVLLTILSFSALFAPSIAGSNYNENSIKNDSDTKVSEYTEIGYLELFGCKSAEVIQSTNTVATEKVESTKVYHVCRSGLEETMNVESSFQKKGLTPGSYVYTAKFTSSAGEEYSVVSSVAKTYGINTITTTATQEITGALNLSLSTKETKTIGSVITKQISSNIQFSNLTGKYYYISNTSGTWSLDEQEILEAQATVKQNMVGQGGTYLLSFAPSTSFSLPIITNGTWTKCTITMPDGTTVDPWSASIPVANDGWDGWTRLVGWVFAWMPSEETVETVVTFIVGFAMIIISAEWDAVPYFLSWIGAALEIFSLDAELGTYYKSSMLYENHPITCHYLEFKLWCGFFPYCHESGYCTDLYYDNPLYGGGWWYIPTSESIWYLPPLVPCHPLSNPWPVWSQPEPSPCYTVTLLGTEDTSYNYVFSNVWIDGDWAGGCTGTAFPLPAGTYAIQVSDYNGVFHYFDVDGTPVYDNPANITVTDENFTITAHYYHDPFHLMTVNVYNQYYYTGSEMRVYVDDQYAGYTDYDGSFSVLLPEGSHLIGVDEYVDDYYDNYIHFEYPELVSHTVWYLYVDGNYYYTSEAYVSVTSDKTVEAWYNSDG